MRTKADQISSIEDVPDNALVGFPPRQTIKEGRGGKRDD